MVIFSAVFGLVVYALITEPVAPTIFESSVETQTAFKLENDINPIKLNDQFKLTVSFTAAKTIHFAQALIEFDPQLITPNLDKIEKRTPLTRFKVQMVGDNRLRISATSIDPDHLDLNNLSGVGGQQSLATIPFQVKSLPENLQSKISIILSPQETTDINWEQNSALVVFNADATADNLLTQAQNLSLTFVKDQVNQQSPSPSPFPSQSPSIQPSPTPSSNPAPSTTNFNEDFYNLFNTATDSATEVIQASESAEPAVNVSAEVPLPPPPKPVNLPIWQRFFTFLSTLLGL